MGSKFKLFSEGNFKIDKTNNVQEEYIEAILHLAPDDLSGYRVCPFADACRKGCLNTAGAAFMQKGKDASRIRRTKMLFEDREGFAVMLFRDIWTLKVQCWHAKKKPLIRLNGTSDLAWETMRLPDRTIMELFPDVQFMDYTKWTYQKRTARETVELPKNYHLTFSLSVANDKAAKEWLAHGVNIAVVFSTAKGAPLPATFWDLPVIDGDTSDVRVNDPHPAVVGLRAKGRAIYDTTGFVRHPRTQKPITDGKFWEPEERAA